ncbi:MAG: radical SAM family heme chaperone HemW [Sedimentisphaerales bacterium]|nr:radical SAM family heme chaperone HemW [Sedimentisphaerales bacterium]
MKESLTPALYVHIPFCRAKCGYCGFYSEPLVGHDSERLLAALLRELDGYALREAATIYIGGGSPSCLPEGQLESLIEQLNQRFPNSVEFTVEVNPAQMDRPRLEHLRQGGVNRLSIGVQSFNERDLVTLGRPYKPQQILSLVKQARQAGFANISLDLIFAIPGSTLSSWKKSLNEAIRLEVEHISAYALTYESDTPLERLVQKGTVTPVDEETDRAMYETTIEMLAEGGFDHYEISNFARPGFACRHNLMYWGNEPYVGIGPSAGSFYQGRRTTNIADVEKYIEAVEQSRSSFAEVQTPDAEALACETAVLMLRRIAGINREDFKRKTGRDVFTIFANNIEYHRKSGMLEVTDEYIRLTRQALPIADTILCDFAGI